MQDIKTFVYFDLEATGLKSSGRPRVCEMSLIAVNASDIKDLHESIMNILSGTVNENSSVLMENIYPRLILDCLERSTERYLSFKISYAQEARMFDLASLAY